MLEDAYHSGNCDDHDPKENGAIGIDCTGVGRVSILVSILQLKNASSKLDLSRLYDPLVHVTLESVPFPKSPSNLLLLLPMASTLGFSSPSGN